MRKGDKEIMKNEELRTDMDVTTLKELKPGTAFVIAYPKSWFHPDDTFVVIKEEDRNEILCAALKANDVVLIDSNESVIIVDAKTALEVAKR